MIWFNATRHSPNATENTVFFFFCLHISKKMEHYKCVNLFFIFVYFNHLHNYKGFTQKSKQKLK